MPNPILIRKDHARRFLLTHLRLQPPRKLRGKQGVLDYIRHVNCIQYDPINVVGQNPQLVLQSRVRDYKPAMLDALLYKDRKLLDGFDKQMSIYPVEGLVSPTTASAWSRVTWKASSPPWPLSLFKASETKSRRAGRSRRWSWKRIREWTGGWRALCVLCASPWTCFFMVERRSCTTASAPDAILNLLNVYCQPS
jgi:hypothetical protein